MNRYFIARRIAKSFCFVVSVVVFVLCKNSPELSTIVDYELIDYFIGESNRDDFFAYVDEFIRYILPVLFTIFIIFSWCNFGANFDSKWSRGCFFGISWRWRYSGKNVVGLHAWCFNCDNGISTTNNYKLDGRYKHFYSCHECGFESAFFDCSPRELKLRISDDISKLIK